MRTDRVALLALVVAWLPHAVADECADNGDVCTDAGPQFCIDLDAKRPGGWGCICSNDFDGDTYTAGMPSPSCLKGADPTPAPPTPTPPTPTPPTEAPTPPPATPAPTPTPPTPAPTTPEPLGPWGCFIIPECDLYSPSVTADSRECSCGECSTGFDPAPDGKSCVPGTPQPTDAPSVPTPKPPPPPAGFKGLCPTVLVPGTDTFELKITLGMAGDKGEAAVRYEVRMSGQGRWGGVGLRDHDPSRPQNRMTGLDIIGFDDVDPDARVYDCEEVQPLFGKPTISPPSRQTTNLERYRKVGPTATYSMWRYFDNGIDYMPRKGVPVDLARATGSGAFGDKGHGATPNDRQILTQTLTSCPEFDALVTRTPAPAPEAWTCDFIHFCSIYTPGPLGPKSTDCRCGVCDDGYVAQYGGVICSKAGEPVPPAPVTPPPTTPQGPFGCDLIVNCDLYGPGTGVGTDCTCGRCLPGAELSADKTACTGYVPPFTCKLIEGCQYYVPSQSSDNTDCTCGFCQPGFEADTAARKCMKLDIPPTALPPTAAPSTGEPTTGEPTTGIPVVPMSTGEPTTGEPTTGEPNTASPATSVPDTDAPPTTDAPAGSTAAPTRQPTTGEPSTGEPTTGEPTTGEPTTGEPITGTPTTGEPTTGIPTTGQPTTGVPTTGVPGTYAPAVAAAENEVASGYALRELIMAALCGLLLGALCVCGAWTLKQRQTADRQRKERVLGACTELQEEDLLNSRSSVDRTRGPVSYAHQYPSHPEHPIKPTDEMVPVKPVESLGSGALYKNEFNSGSQLKMYPPATGGQHGLNPAYLQSITTSRRRQPQPMVDLSAAAVGEESGMSLSGPGSSPHGSFNASSQRNIANNYSPHGSGRISPNASGRLSPRGQATPQHNQARRTSQQPPKRIGLTGYGNVLETSI